MRRGGIEESLADSEGVEIRQVAGTRRRPLNQSEMLRSVVEKLSQRLIVVPMIASSLEKRLGAKEIFWRVDTEFSLLDRFPEASLGDLLPSGVDEVSASLHKIQLLLREFD